MQHRFNIDPTQMKIRTNLEQTNLDKISNSALMQLYYNIDADQIPPR